MKKHKKELLCAYGRRTMKITGKHSRWLESFNKRNLQADSYQ